MDGTIIDSAEGIITCIRRALSQLNYSHIDEVPYHEFIGPAMTDSFQRYCGFDRDLAYKAIQIYREHYSAGGMYLCKVYEGIPDVLKSIKSQNKQIVLATAKPLVYARKILDKFGLLEYFDCTYGSGLDGSLSNKDEVIKEFIDKEDIDDLNQCVMVGDRKYDINGARINGIDSIGVTYGFGDLTELVKSGATNIAHSPIEILKFI